MINAVTTVTIRIQHLLMMLLAITGRLYGYSGPFYVATNGNDLWSGSNAAPFRTIQKAADMMTGGVASATCFIRPGIYREKVSIYSNNNPGMMVFCKYSNIAPVMNGSAVSNFAIRITNAGRIMVSGLRITQFTNGIIMLGTAADNTVRSNTFFRLRRGVRLSAGASRNSVINNLFYSNTLVSVHIDQNGTDHNTVQANLIFSTNGAYSVEGIRIDDGHNNRLTHNIIRNNSDGIVLQGWVTNTHIAGNSIYSNQNYGIHFIGDGADRNKIYTNDIWGAIQDAGVYVYQCNGNIILSNRIHHNQVYGISFLGNSTNNYIIRNAVFSNGSEGIALSGNSKLNFILSNTVFGENQDYGIDTDQGSQNRIFRNLLYKNRFNGIRLSDADGYLVVNNTVYGCLTSHGILWENNSSGTMFNNIVLSNGDGAGDYGIRNAGTGLLYAAYNCLYGNAGGMTNGGFVWGPGNVTSDPLIDTGGPFVITSAQSPCVDTGTVIPGASDGYEGWGPDMGWKEYPSGAVWLTVLLDKSPGRYTGDTDLKLTAYKDAVQRETDPAAVITVTIFRNNGLYRTLTGTGVCGMTLAAGAGYTLHYWAKNPGNITSRTQEAGYEIVRETRNGLAVYPTVIDLGREERIVFMYGEKTRSADIKIYSLRGDIVKTFSGADFSTGSYETGAEHLRFLPAGQYIAGIAGKRCLFFLIK